MREDPPKFKRKVARSTSSITCETANIFKNFTRIGDCLVSIDRSAEFRAIGKY